MTLQSTVASIQNVRKQRQLELELIELERKWHVELKVIARERLGLVKELCRINRDQRVLDHFQDSMHGKDLTRFTDRAHGRLQHTRELKQLRKYDFHPDPVEKMNLHLPLIKDQEDVEEQGEDIAKAVTAKDLYKQRVQLQKTNFEQCMADRRSRRRPFWDKAVLGSKKKKKHQKDRNDVFQYRPRMMGFSGPPLQDTVTNKAGMVEEEGEVSKVRTLTKSPSLPALNTLRKPDNVKANHVHPSLSKNHSASMDYLPVIRGTRGHHGLLTSLKEVSASSPPKLPTIVET